MSINKSTSKKKDYLANLSPKFIVESSEETEREKQEKIERVLKSYHKGMTQADALSALDELSDVVTYDIGQLFGKSGMFILQHLSEIDELCDSEKKLLYRAKGRNDIISSYGIRKDVL